MEHNLREGWGQPDKASKPHFFKAGDLMSLCGRWRFGGYRNPKSGDEHNNNQNDCVTCKRKKGI